MIATLLDAVLPFVKHVIALDADGLPRGLALERRAVARGIVGSEVGGVGLKLGDEAEGLFLDGGVGAESDEDGADAGVRREL